MITVSLISKATTFATSAVLPSGRTHTHTHTITDSCLTNPQSLVFFENTLVMFVLTQK